MEKYAIFISGVAAGIAWYKFFISHILGRYTHTMCDYCEFAIKKNELFPPIFPRKKKKTASGWKQPRVSDEREKGR